MPSGMTWIQPRIYASACIASYYAGHLVDYVVSEDPYIRLLGMRDECECLRCSSVMKIHAVLHDAYGKLRSEYRMGPGYCYCLPSCSRFSSLYLGHIMEIIYCLWNYRAL